MSQFQSILCHKCTARLHVDERALRGVILCTRCGSQFRMEHPWPIVRTSGKALASFVLGIGSIGGLCFAGVPALILGLWALSDMRQPRGGEILTGRRLAIFGAALGGVMSLTSLVLPLLLISPPATFEMQPRRAAPVQKPATEGQPSRASLRIEGQSASREILISSLWSPNDLT